MNQIIRTFDKVIFSCKSFLRQQHARCHPVLLLILKPSRIDVGGIGVFTTSNIPAGTHLPLFAPRDCQFLSDAAMRKLPSRRYLKRHSVKSKGGHDAPVNWNRMSVGWYLNHSDTPNAAHRGFRYYALRRIRKGEEITSDYKTFASKRAYGIR